MKRRWNVPIWAGLIVVLAGAFTYVPIFSRFPVTRDFPWANLLLLVIGAFLIVTGVARSIKQPGIYGGKIIGSILAALSIAAIGLLLFSFLYELRQLPRSSAAPAVGQKAPDFTLPDQNGKPVTLAELISSNEGQPAKKAAGALLIFYRGYW